MEERRECLRQNRLEMWRRAASHCEREEGATLPKEKPLSSLRVCFWRGPICQWQQFPLQSQHCCISCPSLQSLCICNLHTLSYVRALTLLPRWFLQEASRVPCGNKRESGPFMGWKEKADLTLNKNILITRNPRSQFHINRKLTWGIWKVVTHESFHKY